MIGRRSHASEPGRVVFVPLHMRAARVWTRAGLGGACADEMAAARTCAIAAATMCGEAMTQARILRALCEHPEFEFTFAGLDADTLRSQAQTLDEMLQVLEVNVDRLLDTPEPSDVVRLAGVAMDVGRDGTLTPREARDGGGQDGPWSGSDGEWLERICAAVVEVFGGMAARGSRARAGARVMALLEDIRAQDAESVRAGREDAGAGREHAANAGTGDIGDADTAEFPASLAGIATVWDGSEIGEDDE